MALGRRRISLITVAVAIAIVFVITHVARDREIIELAHKARLFESPYPAAIDQLARLNGDRATAELLSVALDEKVFDGNRAAAIRALSKRPGIKIGIALAGLIRPDEGLYLREVISEVLSQRECGNECMRLILEYLQRRSCGEMTGEENLQRDPIDPREAEVEQRLQSILRAKPARVSALLAERFGIRKNSRAPSPFAINLIEILGLKSTCADVHSSYLELVRSRATNTKLLNELVAAEEKLGCELNTGPPENGY